MTVDQNIRTVSKYNFIGLSEATIEGNLTTVFKESHRIPDTWSFSIREMGLFDPDRNGYVHDIVKDYPHPNLYLRRLEDSIIEAMDTWAVSDQEGYLVWISPSFIGHYPCHKIEILYKNPTVRETSNIVILFDGSKEVCTKVTHQLFSELAEINDLEEIRNSILIKPDLDINRIIEIVGPYIHTEKVKSDNPEEDIKCIAKLAKNGVSQTLIAYEMDRVGVMGSRSFSCPGGLANILSQKSNILEAKFVKNCGKCGKVIEKYICKGFECECGGVYEGC
jgi:hypothetical protein